MSMGEESSDKAISVAMRVNKLAYDEMRKAVDKLLAKLTADHSTASAKAKATSKGDKATPTKTPELKHGRQTLKQLSAHNSGLSTVELKAPHMRQLRREMARHNVDFSVVKDGKGAYTLFSRARTRTVSLTRSKPTPGAL